jgi:hypothetical protein
MEYDINYFSNYDYSLMEDPEFKEDSVREEIISPLLNMLGYAAGGNNRIIRSRSLKHPFLTVGSSKRKVTYIPDYLLEVPSGTVLVLDAKAPAENITNGSNVEQVYGYAIHPEIRSYMFALCNGKELVLFLINETSPEQAPGYP